jgi:hypothetical protein
VDLRRRFEQIFQPVDLTVVLKKKISTESAIRIGSEPASAAGKARQKFKVQRSYDLKVGSGVVFHFDPALIDCHQACRDRMRLLSALLLPSQKAKPWMRDSVMGRAKRNERATGQTALSLVKIELRSVGAMRHREHKYLCELSWRAWVVLFEHWDFGGVIPWSYTGALDA